MATKPHLLLCIIGCLIGTGCVHRIHVSPLPTTMSSLTIPRSLQLMVSPITMVGADHRPGITLLKWSENDLTQAVVRYLQQRGTFASVSTDRADLTLSMATKLSLTSRQNRYHYRIHLHAEMKESAQLVKSYVAEQDVAGSMVRWVTASDRDPIESALQLALEELMTQIEADNRLYIGDAKPQTP